VCAVGTLGFHGALLSVPNTHSCHQVPGLEMEELLSPVPSPGGTRQAPSPQELTASLCDLSA